jgi:hypothetical protein
MDTCLLTLVESLHESGTVMMMMMIITNSRRRAIVKSSGEIMLKKADQGFNPMCPGLSGTIGSLLDDGTYEPKAVNMPIGAFLNMNEGLQGDEGVIDEDGDIVDPFGGEILTRWI